MVVVREAVAIEIIIHNARGRGSGTMSASVIGCLKRTTSCAEAMPFAVMLAAWPVADLVVIMLVVAAQGVAEIVA
jgi:hypothetical protein